MKKDYWYECVEGSLNDLGIKLTEKQIDCIAGDIEVSHENYGMAMGYDAIPNPVNSQIEELKRKHKEEIERLESHILCYRKSVAERRNVPVEDVFLEDGRVIWGKAFTRC